MASLSAYPALNCLLARARRGWTLRAGQGNLPKKRE
jgi:hypothetical protein